MIDEREERARERNKRILSWVIVFLMVSSVAGFYFGSSDTTKVKYNGITFTPTSQGVSAKIDGERYLFNFLPAQVEGIAVDPSVVSLLSSPLLFVTYDPASNYSQSMAQVQYYLSDIFTGRFNTYVSLGVSQNASFPFPIVTCANATAAEPTILLAESNFTSVTLEGSCITATAAFNEDVLRIADKLVYLRLGVMNQ